MGRPRTRRLEASRALSELQQWRPMGVSIAVVVVAVVVAVGVLVGAFWVTGKIQYRYEVDELSVSVPRRFAVRSSAHPGAVMLPTGALNAAGRTYPIQLFANESFVYFIPPRLLALILQEAPSEAAEMP